MTLSHFGLGDGVSDTTKSCDLCPERCRCKIIPYHRPKEGRNTAHCKQHGFDLIIDLLAAPLFAQRPVMGYKSPPQILPKTPDGRVVGADSSQPAASEKKMCSIQPFPGIPSTISVTSLQIPHKAQKEYEEASAALKNCGARGGEVIIPDNDKDEMAALFGAERNL